MDWYVIVKVINGQRYRYRQKTWRVGKQVRCASHYLGRCNTTVRGYHGTFAKFDKFDESKLGIAAGGPDTGAGFFFASNPRVAISYASTELAAQRGLDTTIRTIEARIEAITGEEWRDAEEKLEEGGYAHDKAIENKLKTYLQRRERAQVRWRDLCARGIFDQLELAKRANLKECRITMKDAYYFDNENRVYSPWTYLTAIEKARELGCDGVVIKNTYDMGTPSLCYSGDDPEVDDMTHVFIAFSPEQVVAINQRLRL
jgi:ADP-Ribosyltransferase in polyvalent proteins